MATMPYFDATDFDTSIGEAIGLRAYSATDFITKALRLLNVIDAISVPEAEQLEQGYDALQEMIDDWRLHTQLVLIITPYRHPLVAGKQVYTIGPNGDFNQNRPVEITRWTFIMDRNQDPLIRIPHARALTLPEWHGMRITTTPGAVVSAIYYDRGWNDQGQGQVFVYPVPTVSVADIELWTPTPLQGFATPQAKYVFPPGYTRAIRYNLAVELALEYPGALTEGVMTVARQSIADVKRGNFRPRYAEFDIGMVGRGRRYDPYTDT